MDRGLTVNNERSSSVLRRPFFYRQEPSGDALVSLPAIPIGFERRIYLCG